MLDFLMPLRGLETGAVLFRMLIACVCGAVIGLERSADNQPAGLRTHILVCIATTVAMSCGLYFYLKLELVSDISRIGAQVVTGLGFLGAGTIIVKRGAAIKGLTTAAGLWTTGIIGLCIGTGYYELAVLGTIMVLMAETLFSKVAKRIGLNPMYEFTVYYRKKEALDEVMRYLKDRRMTVQRLEIHALTGEDAGRYVADINVSGNANPQQLLESIFQKPDIIDAQYRDSEKR